MKVRDSRQIIATWCFLSFWQSRTSRFQNLISSESQSKGWKRCCQRPYFVEYTRSHPNSEVKRRKARSVLGWGTAREALRVLLAFFLRFSMPFIFWSEMFQILYMFTSYHSPRTPLENSFLVNQPLPTLAPLGFLGGFGGDIDS